MDDEIAMVISQSQKLIDQIESDNTEMHKCLQGTIYDAYQELVDHEIELLETVKKNLSVYNKME